MITPAKDTLPPTLQELKADLQNAVDAMGRAKTYDNALSLQRAKRRLKHYFDGERKAFFIINGDEGLHSKTPYDIALAALYEVERRANELDVPYISKVVEQALVTLGEGIELDGS